MVEEDILVRSGYIPVDDDRIGQGYETCPLHHKSLIKNAVSFAYALAPKDFEPVEQLRQVSHLREQTQVTRCRWAFFVLDETRFPVPAMLSAVVQALVAKVETIIVSSVTPCSSALFFGLDLLAVDQIYEEHDPGALVACLKNSEPGIVLNFTDCPMPADHHVLTVAPYLYRCTEQANVSADLRAAYQDLFACAHVPPDQPAYLAYGDGTAGHPSRYALSSQLLGCWMWDGITPDTFRITHTRFTYDTKVVAGHDS